MPGSSVKRGPEGGPGITEGHGWNQPDRLLGNWGFVCDDRSNIWTFGCQRHRLELVLSWSGHKICHSHSHPARRPHMCSGPILMSEGADHFRVAGIWNLESGPLREEITGNGRLAYPGRPLRANKRTCPIRGGPPGPQLKWNWNYS